MNLNPPEEKTFAKNTDHIGMGGENMYRKRDEFIDDVTCMKDF
jgi:hypothetical protein